VPHRTTTPRRLGYSRGMRRLAASLATVGLAACSPPPLDCVQPLDLSCTQLYPPDFDDVFQDTLIPKCSTGGGSCHTPTAA